MSSVNNRRLSIPAGSDYQIVDQPSPYTISIWHAETGHGKTSIATEFCPQPVHLINFDGRAKHTVRKALDRGRRILHSYVPCPVGASRIEAAKAKKAAEEAIDRFITRNWSVSIREAEKGNCASLVLDTGTELSETAYLAITGQFMNLKDDYGQSKGQLNLFWRRLFMDARRTNVHLVILARTKELWANSRPTGIFVPRGPTVMEEGADFSAMIRKTRKRKGVMEFDVLMTNPKLDITQTGEVYKEEDWGSMGPFIYAALMQGVDIDIDVDVNMGAR